MLFVKALVMVLAPLLQLYVYNPLPPAVITVAEPVLAPLHKRLAGVTELIVGPPLLLIVAVGSNYALFFNRPSTGKHGAEVSPQTLTSLAFANLTTVCGFGLLGSSQVPVLQAIGITVGPGAVLALIFSAIFSLRNEPSTTSIYKHAEK